MTYNECDQNTNKLADGQSGMLSRVAHNKKEKSPQPDYVSIHHIIAKALNVNSTKLHIITTTWQLDKKEAGNGSKFDP